MLMYRAMFLPYFLVGVGNSALLLLPSGYVRCITIVNNPTDPQGIG
jgi:hypothetical protein